MLKIKRLTPTAQLPTKAYKNDAGWDLYTDESCRLWRNQIIKINTNIAIEIPIGYVGLIKDKSGLATKGLHVVAGVIDSSFRGPLQVCMINLAYTNEHSPFGDHYSELYEVDCGQKIAQLLVQKVEDLEVVEVKELSKSERNERGFGSSGLY